jgi:hypothetical protein
MTKPNRDLSSIADEQAVLGMMRYRATRWIIHRAFWLFWLLPATNIATAFVFASIPFSRNTLGALISGVLCMHLSVIGIGLVVKLMIANPPWRGEQ